LRLLTPVRIFFMIKGAAFGRAGPGCGRPLRRLSSPGRLTACTSSGPVAARRPPAYAQGIAVELPIHFGAPPATDDRAGLVPRARALAWLGVAWHVVEAAIAILAGVAASSIALVGFGADSLIESVAGFIVLWRFAAARTASSDAERRAQQLIAISFYVLAAYVAIEAVRSLAAGKEPATSWVGIALAVFTVATMPPLAIAKARVGTGLGSSATKSEGRQNMVCAYLSLAVLAGLGANALLGWWWADPVAALAIAAVALREGRNAWRGEDSCCAPTALDAVGDTDTCRCEPGCACCSEAGDG
jgi:Cation efflux family